MYWESKAKVGATYHSLRTRLELTLEVMHLPQKGSSLFCLQLKCEQYLPFGSNYSYNLYNIIMQILNI